MLAKTVRVRMSVTSSPSTDAKTGGEGGRSFGATFIIAAVLENSGGSGGGVPLGCPQGPAVLHTSSGLPMSSGLASVTGKIFVHEGLTVLGFVRFLASVNHELR